jgi:hypothetical protein
MEHQPSKFFGEKISDIADNTTKIIPTAIEQRIDKQQAIHTEEANREDTEIDNTKELLRLKACILNHARRRPHEHASVGLRTFGDNQQEH